MFDKKKIIELLSKGPVGVYIDADIAFKDYKSGILPSDIKCEYANHAVILVGIDRDQKGEYYILRNSHGSSWGEKGYFRIYINPNDITCQIENWVIYPEVKKYTIIPAKVKPVLPVKIPVDNSNCLTAYSECNFKGSSRVLCSGTSTANMIVKSYQAGKFKTMTFFKDGNCKSFAYPYEEKSNKCIDASLFKSSIGSIALEDESPRSGCIYAYTEACYAGEKWEICNDVSELNVKVASIRFADNISSVNIFTEKNFSGEKQIVFNNQYTLEGKRVFKNSKSIKLEYN